MLGVFAEFETNLRRERQLEGIAKAKTAGVCKGRFYRGLTGAGIEGSGHAAHRHRQALKIGRASVYRVLATSA
jgi:DNA invertase Pin-like site-specific DNA recombinase